MTDTDDTNATGSPHDTTPRTRRPRARAPSAATATADPRAELLDGLREHANVSRAARAAGMTRAAALALRAGDAGFAALWDDAVAEAVDGFVAEVHRRAFEGYEKPVFYQGEEVATVREYSDTLAMFLLRAHRPETFNLRADAAPPPGDDDPIKALLREIADANASGGPADGR
jgi:hypothetical protein